MGSKLPKITVDEIRIKKLIDTVRDWELGLRDQGDKDDAIILRDAKRNLIKHKLHIKASPKIDCEKTVALLGMEVFVAWPGYPKFPMEIIALYDDGAILQWPDDFDTGEIDPGEIISYEILFTTAKAMKEYEEQFPEDG